MDYIEQIKNSIEKLFQSNPNIHISVNRTRPKIIVMAEPAKIVGVYRNIFQIEECESGKAPIRHTFQYSDVLVGQVVIEELDYVPIKNDLNKK